jgi:hypothetical protein
MIRRVFLAIAIGLVGCGSSDEVKIDYTVSFTDAAGKSLGTLDSGSLTSIESTVGAKTLMMGSTATFEVKSDMNGAHFTIVEDGMRKGQLTCTKQAGTGTASASANLSTGGHYFMSLTFKGARCIAEQ